jgi:pimeloyl-ACP methyl ester carboxylesterase
MAKVRAFCIGGLLGGAPFNFSIGMQQLSDKLNKIPNVSATYEQNSLLPLAVISGLIKAGIAAARTRALVIVGHSYGAEAASWIAGALYKLGIKVALLVVVDTVVTQGSIPPTGGDRILYFQKVDPMGGGRPSFDPGPGEAVVHREAVNHVAMAQLSAMHNDVITRTKALVAAQ